MIFHLNNSHKHLNQIKINYKMNYKNIIIILPKLNNLQYNHKLNQKNKNNHPKSHNMMFYKLTPKYKKRKRNKNKKMNLKMPSMVMNNSFKRLYKECLNNLKYFQMILWIMNNWNFNLYKMIWRQKKKIFIMNYINQKIYPGNRQKLTHNYYKFWKIKTKYNTPQNKCIITI